MPDAIRILFFENNPAYFLSHRLVLARALQQKGYAVHVAAIPGEASEAVRAAGFEFHPLRFSRGSMNPCAELLTLWRIYHLYHKVKPELVYQVTIKPVIYGTLAARCARVPRVVSVVSGFGYFALRTNFSGKLLRGLVFGLYRFALRHAHQRVIFHNADDCEEFMRRGILRADDTQVVPGSGVDTSHFIPSEEPSGIPAVVLPARPLRDKGVYEYIEAAKMLRAAGVQARFLLAGGADPGNPGAIPEAQLRQWTEEGDIEWLGHVLDMCALYAASNIVCLPSYREGMAKVLVEAMACARPVVTTDVPGCRDAVLAGETGLLVPSHNSNALAAALRTLIQDRELRQRMGARARTLAEGRFSAQRVVARTMEILHGLMAKSV